ncbi:hypothetical protein GPECTOR_8g56 [Gonium pectorale]|uniref:Ankyrin repeat domain-containing protein n=1 Tax=Gonium pectorale TaxID=33097 RepID=A0A150GTK9_GONPE|nr:hypothetical protein GPECTOR_8g56 [Gonium pectorale]|eukprot:KXZ53062.1 hypothetical protein GPECTOR_8g56 [Gonium pectorale]
MAVRGQWVKMVMTVWQVDKATLVQFRGRPEFASVRLSQPVPPHAFAARWAAPGAMRDLTMEQRRQLLRLTAASGVMANLDAALEAVGFVLDRKVSSYTAGCRLKEKTDMLRAACTMGHVGMVLSFLDRRYGDKASSLRIAAEAGHQHLCETLLGDRLWELWRVQHAVSALSGGHPELADWLLQLRTGGPALAPLGGDTCGELLEAAAKGCELPVLVSLRQRCSDLYIDQDALLPVLIAAAGSTTADWQQKLRWAEHQMPDGFRLNGNACAAAAGCPDGGLRLSWLLRRRYPADASSLEKALLCGNTEGLELLVRRGLRPKLDTIEAAARLGHLEVLKKLRQIGFGLAAAAIARAAAEGGQLPVLVWAVEELGASVEDPLLIRQAVKRCDLEALRWLRQRGCPLDGDEEVALAAAGSGQLPVLEWYVQELRGPVRSGAALEAAAATGRVEVLAWLRQRFWPWGSDTWVNAAGAGCEVALEWLAERGCPMPESSRDA